jgi:hypothetical protein
MDDNKIQRLTLLPFAMKFVRHRRFDNNAQLTGPVPTNLKNLTKLAEL